MANQHRPVVNQRLYFSRLHLQWLQRELASTEFASVTVEQALGESLLLHLHRAYQAYLLELAESYGLHPDSLESATRFMALLDEQGKPCAEANELCALESSNSWLAEMLASATSAVLPGNTPATNATIAVVHVEAAGLCERGQHYLDELCALIESQRGRLEEW